MVRRARPKKAHNPWREYERGKKRLQHQGMTGREHEAAVRALAKQMKL